MIQALARWRSDKSVVIYARLNPLEYSGWVTKAMQQTTMSRTVVCMPVIDTHRAVAKLELELVQSHMAQKPMLRGEVQRGRHLPVGRVLLSRGGRWRGR